MVIFLMVIWSVMGLNYDSVLILYSQSTQIELISEFGSFPNKFPIEMYAQSHLDSISLIIDITQNATYFSFLENLCEYFQSFYFTITSESKYTLSRFRLQALSSPESEGRKLAGLITSLNWTSFTLISFSSPESIKYSTSVKENTLIPSSLYILQENLNQAYLDRTIKRVIKTSGQVNFVIVGSGPEVSAFQQVLILRKANKSNLKFLYPSFALDQVFIENSLIFGLHGSESSKSYWESVYLFLTVLVDRFLSLPQSEFFKTCLQNDCSDFDIVKIKNSQKVVVGKFGQTLETQNLDELRGNDGSSSISSEILVFIANGTSELNQSNVYFKTAYFYHGSLFAVEKANKEIALKGFHYKTQTTDCGNLVYNEDWYKYCFLKLVNKHPVGYLTSLYLTGAYGTALTLKSLGLNIPQISGFSNSKDLDSPANFSDYFSLTPQLVDLLLNGMSVLLEVFEWRYFILFISPEYYVLTLQIDIYVNSGKLAVLNPLDMRVIPSNYSISEYDQYKEYFEFALKSKCRLFMVLTQNPGPILESLYKVGFRKGDFMGIWNPYTLMNDLLESAGKNFDDIQELMQGSIIVSTKEWDGEGGKELKETLTELFTVPEYMCLTHDSFEAIHHSVKYLISIGEDFEDPAVMTSSIRNQRFSGCMGKVYFNSLSNHWPGVKTLLRQFVKNEETGKLEQLDIFSADIFSQTLITIINAPQWPNSDKSPSNFIDYGECNFDPKLSRHSSSGLLVMIIVCALVLIFTIFFSVLGLKKFRNLYKEFKHDEMISISDMLFIACIVLEYFQYISLEPEGGLFKVALNNVTSFLAFSFPYYYDFRFDNFWRFYMILIGLAFFFTVIAFLSLLDTKKSQNLFSSSDQFINLTKLFMTFMVNAGYLPMIHLLLEITQCTNSTGKSLSSTYFKKDCLQSCYSGKHMKYSIFGLSGLFLFLATSSYSKIFWESINPDANIRTSPFYLTSLSIFKMILLTSRLILREYSETVSGFFMSGILLLFTIYSYNFKSFNLERIQILQVVLLFMSFWGMLFSTLHSLQRFQSIFTIVCFLGMASIFILGIFKARKYPKGFFDQKGISIKSLVKFQFSTDPNVLFQDSIFQQSKNVKVKVAFVD